MTTKKAETKRLSVKEDMTIYNAPGQKQQFLSALAQTASLELDLHAITEMDAAGLQLLLLLKREAVQQGRNLSLINHGPRVLQVIDFCNLGGTFGDPMVITSRSSPEAGDEAGNKAGDGSVGETANQWHISVRFGTDLLRHGSDPLTVLNGLAALGDIVMMETIAESLPAAAEMDPESCYLGFEIRLQTHASKAEIENVFKFVRDECTLHILPPDSKVIDFLQLIASLPTETMRLGDILVKCGALTKAELDAGLQRQSDASAAVDEAGEPLPDAPIGEILVEQKAVHKEVVEAAADKQKSISEKQATDAGLIRVHADKLDELIDQVGELVIAGASANLLARRNGDSALVEANSVLSRLVETIRDSALQLRMVQIGETFNRFHSITRDLSQELGKDIDLVINGAETELDKSVVEKIGDPLMHLVRNAMDHGIESAEARVAAGKPARGRIELNAYHESGSIVIEVADDGRGLDLETLQAKAIEKGLIQPGQTLSDQEISNLIFDADGASGHGAGMGVVSKSITALRGTVIVKTEPGLGSRFTIRLPLTLAIIDGFLTGVAKSSYVIPLDTVVECIELANTSADRDYINLRGEVLPYVRLRELFEVPGQQPSRENVVVVQYAGQKAGIVVDQLLGEFQTVIKPLGTLFRHMRGIGGSTILGSGEVALILDVQALVSRSARSEEQASHGATGTRRLETH
jgi:two-component system chemotaxis sensor kinase CheA